MNKPVLSLPEQRNYDYSLKLAFDVARDKLNGITDIAEQCRRCGASLQAADSRNIITLAYLNRPAQIILPGVRVSPADAGEDFSVREQLLLLHYFIHASGIPLADRVVSFKELAEVKNYYRTFYRRVVQPLVNTFGKEPDNLLNVAQSFGGKKATFGDAAVTIDAFSRVPVTFVLWQGDAEFPPDGSVMFDSSIAGYLPAEDIIVLCEILAWKLVKSAPK